MAGVAFAARVGGEVEGLYAVELLGRSLLSVEVLGVEVLCTGVLFYCTLLGRSLVYVLGEGLLLLQWLRCCCWLR